ncbi:MAG: restriction endonuclease subunit S [Rivularia sp. (in: cyanobacteria)]
MFPDNWQIRTLSFFVSELQAGVSVNSEDRPCRSGEIGILKTSAITGGNFNPQEHKAVLLREHNRVKVSPEEDSIIVSRMNTLELIGESSYIVKSYFELFLPDRLWLLKFRDRNVVSVKWLSYVLSSQKARSYIQLHSTGTSGSMKNLPQSRFLDMPILSPSFKEQQKIAEILDTVEKAIALTQTHINKLKLAKAGLLHDLLTKGIDEHGELRNPKRNPEQFKDSSLGKIPKDWEVKTCESLCKEIVVGIVIRPAQYYQSSGVPVLRSANIRETGINGSDLVFMSEKANQMLSKSMIKVGDILTVRTGYPGISSVVSQKWDSCNCVDLIISRPSCEIDSYFLTLWINSDFGKGQVFRGQGGLAQQHFNVGELQKLLVIKPLIDEQQKITAAFFNYNARIQKKQTRLEKLKLLKLGLMSDLLTGKVRVKI